MQGFLGNTKTVLHSRSRKGRQYTTFLQKISLQILGKDMQTIQSIWFETCEGNSMANAPEIIREEGKDLAATGKYPWTSRPRQGRQPLLRTPPMPAADLPGNRTAMLLLWGKLSKCSMQLFPTQSHWCEGRGRGKSRVSTVAQVGIDPLTGDNLFSGPKIKFTHEWASCII